MDKKLKIDVLANDGSPLGVSEASIYGQDGRLGVGGAELAILTLMAEWTKLGHTVTFYNNPLPGHKSSFRQSPISLFLPQEDRDILIIFRSPNERAKKAKAKLKVWFSTDQYTIGDFKDFSSYVDRIVTISNYHSEYFSSTYGIDTTIPIDLPVRVWEYDREVSKVQNQMLFCSVPTRGLDIMAKCFPEIQKEVRDVSLVITSDFRLWGTQFPMNDEYIRKFLGVEGVKFLGAIPREQLIAVQSQSEIHAYPCTYEELFCYSSAECQVAGAFPISSATGALITTNMGILIHGDPQSRQWQSAFIEVVVKVIQNREEFQAMAKQIQSEAKKRFSPERILTEWNERVFYG